MRCSCSYCRKSKLARRRKIAKTNLSEISTLLVNIGYGFDDVRIRGFRESLNRDPNMRDSHDTCFGISDVDFDEDFDDTML
jgi:hypothetical protein